MIIAVKEIIEKISAGLNRHEVHKDGDIFYCVIDGKEFKIEVCDEFIFRYRIVWCFLIKENDFDHSYEGGKTLWESYVKEGTISKYSKFFS
jgi:hypothetical protein